MRVQICPSPLSLRFQRLESSESRANGGCPPTHYLVVVRLHAHVTQIPTHAPPEKLRLSPECWCGLQPLTARALQVGWHGAKGRRGGGQGLLVKDPMDGNHVTQPPLRTQRH